MGIYIYTGWGTRGDFVLMAIAGVPTLYCDSDDTSSAIPLANFPPPEEQQFVQSPLSLHVCTYIYTHRYI